MQMFQLDMKKFNKCFDYQLEHQIMLQTILYLECSSRLTRDFPEFVF